MELDKVIAVTPFWGRPEVSKIFCENCNDIGLRFIAVTNPQDHENLRILPNHTDLVYSAHQNITGRKWNQGLQILKKQDFEYLIVLGSDDLVSKKYFQKAKGNYFGLSDALAMDLKTKKFRHWPGYTNNRRGESIGPGRIIHRSILEKLSYNLFPDIHKGRIDLISDQRVSLFEECTTIESKLKPYRIGLKTPEALSSLRDYPFIFDIDLKGYYSQKIIDLIYA